ncbi:MAG: hypothetical protein ACYCVD_08740 [Desulfitobacteriaceae bacterium]
MADKYYPVASLTDKELTEIKSLEKELNQTKSSSEKVLIAYTKA